MKLASLFDGIGGFPLAATRAGIEPVWASEIEAGPVAITKKHFPGMIHYGDITSVCGYLIEDVDVITFGSPCQDLSVAGKRAGLAGERSGLFMEAIRIIKEMRGATDGRSPRFAVWENVPGAFSSSGGEDFRAVIEELCRVKEQAFEVPTPPGSKWEPAGLVEGDGWSVAWRVLDAQFWGVPQRRKRIFLVADFAGNSAGQILFERESLRGDSAKGAGEGQRTSADAAGGAGTASRNCAIGVSKFPDVAHCLRSGASKADKHESTTYVLQESMLGRMDKNGPQGDGISEEVSFTLNTIDRHAVAVYDMTHADEVIRPVHGDKVNTLNGRTGTGGNQVQVVCQAYDPKDLGRRPATFDNQSPTIKGRCGTGVGNTPVVCQQSYWDGGQVADCLDASKQQAMPEKRRFQAVRVGYRVRRLTPTECERLQGFPDGWTDGFSDTVRYKALGNSVAVPCVEFVMRGIANAAVR